MDIEKDIWRYGQLPEEMQQKIELFVRENTAYSEVLEQVKTLYKILPQSFAFTAEPVDDVALSYYIANQYLGQAHDLPQVLRIGYDTMKARIDGDPALHARYEALRHRMEHIAGHSDPLEQFETLTGHRLETPPKTIGGYAEDRSSSAPAGALSRRWYPRVARGTWALVILLIGAWVYYGNRMARLAFTDQALFSIDNTNVGFRSDEAASTSASLDHQFVYGQLALEESQHQWLGIYYTFDHDQLELAEIYFKNVLNAQDKELADRSNFFLGKIALAKGNVAEARNYFQDAVSGEAAFANKAASLLDNLPALD